MANSPPSLRFPGFFSLEAPEEQPKDGWKEKNEAQRKRYEEQGKGTIFQFILYTMMAVFVEAWIFNITEMYRNGVKTNSFISTAVSADNKRKCLLTESLRIDFLISTMLNTMVQTLRH